MINRSIIGRYDTMYSNSHNSITFLLFTAKWCDACKMIGPLFEERGDMFKDRANFEIVDIDEDENDQIVIQYKIVKIPTIIVIINGKIVNCIDEHLNDQNLDIVIKTYLTKKIENINRRELLINTNINTDDTIVSSR